MDYDFDFVLIDTEAGISENVTYFTSASQDIIVVTTPEPTAITDAYALMKLLSLKYHEKHFNLIVNMVQNEQEALDVFRKLSVVSNRYLDISIDYTGSIPYDPQMKEAIRKQQVFVDRFSSSRTSTAFTHLAERMATTRQRGLSSSSGESCSIFMSLNDNGLIQQSPAPCCTLRTQSRKVIYKLPYFKLLELFSNA
jgi:flagellar biosynthesis protein FlhG